MKSHLPGSTKNSDVPAANNSSAATNIASNISTPSASQNKIPVSKPNDALELEATGIAKNINHGSGFQSPPIQTGRLSNLAAQREAKTDSNTTTHTSGDSLSPHSSGKPLPTTALDFFNQKFGESFDNVRIHDNSHAHNNANQLNANAYTLGSDIVFAAGQYQPHSGTGRKLLAHELTHTLQQRSMPGNIIQRDGPVFVVTEHGPAGSLMGYPYLQRALPADQWQLLNRAAQQRFETECPDDSSSESVTTVQAPLRSLFLPAIAEGAPVASEPWIKAAFRIGFNTNGAIATFGISQIIQADLLNQWMDMNSGILDESVDISLIDPNGLTGGASTLSFRVREAPVETSDGSLLAGSIDRALDNQFPNLISDMQSDVQMLQSSLGKAITARAVADAIDRLIAVGDADLQALALTQAQTRLQSAQADLTGIDGRFSDQVTTLSARLTTLNETRLPERIRTHQTWREANAPPTPITVEANRRAADALAHQREAIKTTPLAGYEGESVNANAMSAAMMSLLFPGEAEAHQAYTEGRISLNTYLNLDSEIQTRGYIVAGVTVAITIATLGLGIYLAPAALGGQIALGGTLGAIDAVVPMIASSVYSGTTSFGDPTASAIWNVGNYSIGDMAIAGGIGFGLGAALPLAGALISRIGTRAEAQALILAVESGERTVLSGASIRQLGGGMLEIAVPEESAVIKITREGWQIFGPAGEEASTLLGSGSWSTAAAGESLPGGLRGRLTYGGRDPFAFHAYDEGWGFLSPRSESPLSYGHWGMEPPGPMATGSPLLPGSPLLLGTGAPEAPSLFPMLPGRPQMPLLGPGTILPPGAIELPNGQGIILRGPLITPPPRAPFGILPESGSSGLPAGDWRIADLAAPPLTDVPASSLPYAADRAWGRSMDNWWLYEPTTGEPIPSRLHRYGTPGTDTGLVLDIPGRTRSLHTDPLITSSGSGRGYPMTTAEMADPITGTRLARSHLDPHIRSRPVTTPEASTSGLSTRDPMNYVGHDTRYNEWVRRTLEGRLSSSRWQAIEVWNTPRATAGGYPIVTEEIIVQLAPNGTPLRAWRFPTTEGAWASASDIEQVLGPRSAGGFEIPLSELPPTLRGTE